jgi:hypothetical protein
MWTVRPQNGSVDVEHHQQPFTCRRPPTTGVVIRQAAHPVAHRRLSHPRRRYPYQVNAEGGRPCATPTFGRSPHDATAPLDRRRNWRSGRQRFRPAAVTAGRREWAQVSFRAGTPRARQPGDADLSRWQAGMRAVMFGIALPPRDRRRPSGSERQQTTATWQASSASSRRQSSAEPARASLGAPSDSRKSESC